MKWFWTVIEVEEFYKLTSYLWDIIHLYLKLYTLAKFMKDKERINASIALYNFMEKNIEYFTIKKSTKITYVSCSIEQIKTLLKNTIEALFL